MVEWRDKTTSVLRLCLTRSGVGEVSSKRKKKGLALAMVFGSSWAVWMVGWPAIHEIGERLLDFVFCLK